MSEVFGVDPDLLGDPELEGTTVDASEDGEQTFTFFPGYYGGDDDPELLYGQNEPEQITEAELKEYYNSDNGLVLREQFGSYDNYLSYMTEREQLIQEGQYDIGNWGSIVEASYVQNHPEIDPADVYGLSRNDFIAKYGLDPSEVQVISHDTNTQRVRGYEEWIESEQIKALNEKYGIAGVYVGENGDVHSFNGSSYVKTHDMPQDSAFETGMQILTVATLGAMTGGAVSGALASSAATAGSVANSIATATGLASSTIGAVGGGIASSAISQLILTGEIDPTKLLQAGLTAGIVDTASLLSNMDPALADSEYLGYIDDQVNSLADALGTNYDTALDIVTGVATGVVNGGDVESIVSGVASTYGASQITDYIEDNIGLAVPNFFREGTTEINRDAVETVTRTFLEDALSGDIDSGTLLDMGLGYIREDGSFAFLDPRLEGAVDLPFDFDFPSIDINLPDIPFPEIDIDLPEFPEVDIDLPEFPEVDIDLPEFPEVDIDLPEVDVDLPEVDIDLPDIDLPDIEGPDLDTPDIEGPDLDTPDVDVPDLDLGEPSSGAPIQAFKEFYSGINYQAPTIQQIVQSPQVDYTASLNDLINRNSGMFG